MDARSAILEDRFLHENEESWDDVAHRTAHFWGKTATEQAAFEEIIRERRALPNTPALANAGRSNAMGSACYVLPINDSLVEGPGSIMGTLHDAAAVHKSGGGTGFSLARIRGKGSLVQSTGREAPGGVNVLKLYSNAIATVTQAGMRPGANMMIMPVDHPDLPEFMECKAEEGDITNFNISVAITDDFMEKVRWGDGDANRTLDKIALGSWTNGEPGVFFIDTTNKASLHQGEWIEATNPCGEVPLRPYEACVLGSLNLDVLSDDLGHIDQGMFDDTVYWLVRLLDNIIEYQTYPLEVIKQEQQKYRKIGVGVMGFADLLAKRGISYGASAHEADSIMSWVKRSTYHASGLLAQERGLYAGAHSGMPERRNLNCQVIAPTGTISRLAQCSFGIEPHFDVDHDGYYLSFVVGGAFTDHNPYYKHDAFTPASQVNWWEHVEVQAAFQKHTDQAVSKTINCPEATTVNDIREAYCYAYDLDVKGMTVLRDQSRVDTVIASTDCASGACPL